ncbi:MAG: sulfotransferase domain-containing protein [Smithella sp.]
MNKSVYNADARKDTIPDNAYVIIIGAMKCGTTSLFSYLSVHPLICPAVVKEAEFFSEHQDHKVSLNSYGDLWKNYDGAVHQYVLEASTGYTKYPAEPNVPEKFRDYGISPKFIYIMRNPFDRIISHFNFMQGRKKWALGISDRHLINVSNYYLQLERYRKYFPVEDMLLLDFDDLRDNPQDVLRKVYNFLHLPACFPEQYEIKNESLPVSPRFRKLVYFLDRFSAGKSKLFMELMPKQKRRLLTDEERAYIHRELKEDMRKLHAVYHVDVQKWGFSM